METAEGPGNGFSQTCSNCDASSFSCWCLDCQEALCQLCVSAHRRVSVTRSHRLLNQPPAEGGCNPPTKFCRLHPLEPLKLFCFTCSQLTCRDCQLTTHMNHRYEFVSEALDGLRRQLEEQLEPISAQRDTVSRSLQDMQTRLQDIVQYEACLKFQLHSSYDAFLQHLKKRKEDLIEEIQKVHKSELDWIHRRMRKLAELQERLQSVADAADKARKISDIMTLQTYRAQIESQLKDLPDQDLSPPQMISQMKVITDSNSLTTLLNFGQLEVSWVPFSVSRTSAQDPGPPGTRPPTSSSSSSSFQSTCRPQTGTTSYFRPPTPVHSSTASSAGHQYPPTYSSFASSSTSTRLTCSTACPPSPASRSPSQTGVTISCSAGAPAKLSTSGQLWLLHSSSFVTGSSAAPPTYTSPRPNPPTSDPNATVEQRWNERRSFLPKTLNNEPLPPSDTSVSLFSILPPGYACQAVCPTGTTCDGVLVSSSSRPTPGSFSISTCSYQNPKQLAAPAGAVCSSLIRPLNPTPSPAQVTRTHALSAVPLVLQPNQSLSHVTPTSAPVGLNESPSPGQKQAAVVLLYRSSLVPPQPLPPTLGHAVTVSSRHVAIPSVTAEKQLSVGLSPKAQADPAGMMPPGPDSSSLEHDKLSHVVKAVADSACDRSWQQVEARQQEPAENEPTSTMCDETEPVTSACEATDSDSDEAAPVPEQRVCSLSQWQPKVSLCRLPVPPARPGRPLPAYRLLRGDAKDEVYLEEMSSGVHTDDASEQPSSPESPVTLQVVSCSACGSANSSIICFSCGRGYHRDCHLPPVGPDLWSDWACSLCQDLSASADTSSSDRPQTTNSPRLSPLNQRRCESLLLYLKVEGCGRLPQSHLQMMVERLSFGRCPYATAAEFLSDSWSLFKQVSTSHLLEDDPLSKLQRSFHVRTMKLFGAELHPSLLTPPDPLPKKDARAESRLKETRKRLGQFLCVMGASAAKRTKKDAPQD